MPSEKEIEEAIKEMGTLRADPNSSFVHGIQTIYSAYLSMKSECDKYKAIVEADAKVLSAVVVHCDPDGGTANCYLYSNALEALVLREKES